METSVAIVCALASVESTRLTAKSTCARLDMTFFAHCNKLLILLVKKSPCSKLGNWTQWGDANEANYLNTVDISSNYV